MTLAHGPPTTANGCHCQRPPRYWKFVFSLSVTLQFCIIIWGSSGSSSAFQPFTTTRQRQWQGTSTTTNWIMNRRTNRQCQPPGKASRPKSCTLTDSSVSGMMLWANTDPTTEAATTKSPSSTTSMVTTATNGSSTTTNGPDGKVSTRMPSDSADADATSSSLSSSSSSSSSYWCYWSTAYELTQAGTVGAMTGLLVALFKLAIEAVRKLCYDQEFLAGDLTLIALVPAVGGLAVGFLYWVGSSSNTSSIANSNNANGEEQEQEDSVEYEGGEERGQQPQRERKPGFPPGLRGTIQQVDNEPAMIAALIPTPPSNDAGSNNNDNSNTAAWVQRLGREVQDQANFARKTAASVATLGTGASLGPEGPCVEIGVNVARACTHFNRPVPSRRRLMTAASETNTILLPPTAAFNNGVDSDDDDKNVENPTMLVSMMMEEEKSPQRGWNRVLLSCGAAAGVAAGFNAPLAGVFFALEIMQNTFNSLDQEQQDQAFVTATTTTSTTSITPILISAVVSSLIAKTILGNHLILKLTPFALNTPVQELPLYLLLGASAGLVAFVFSYSAKLSQQFFAGELQGGKRTNNHDYADDDVENQRDENDSPTLDIIQEMNAVMSSIPNAMKPMMGGLFCGLVGIFFPQVLFFGYMTMNSLFTATGGGLPLSAHPIDLMLSLLGVKIITTAVAAGSGLVGGTFAPALFLGALLGGIFHESAVVVLQTIMDWLLPLIQQNADATTAAAEPTGPAEAVVSFVTSQLEQYVPFLESPSSIPTDMHYHPNIAGVPAYAMVGAASVLAALFRAPLTASLLLFEVTRNYDVIVPLMASAGIASMVGDILEDRLERRDEMERRDRDPVSWGDLASAGQQEQYHHDGKSRPVICSVTLRQEKAMDGSTVSNATVTNEKNSIQC